MTLDVDATIEIQGFLDQVVEVRRANGLSFYVPHSKQRWFHSCGNYAYRLLQTGNRFGKSDCGAAEDVAFALGERPWLPENDPARYVGIPQHSTVGIILCETWEKAEEIFTNAQPGMSIGKLFKFIPQDKLVSVRKNHSGNISAIMVQSKWGGVSCIRIDTVAGWKMLNKKSESSHFDWIHVDEPIPQKMFTGYARGLIDRAGKAWFTCTPISEPWISNFFNTGGSRSGRSMKLRMDQVNLVAENKIVILGSSSDNPYISVAGQDQFSELLTDRERQARLHGVPLEQSGRVYAEVNEDEHGYIGAPEGWAAPNDPPTSWTIRYAIDPHPRTPHAVLFIAQGPDDVCYIFDEIFEPCTGEELAALIKQKTDVRFVASAIIDPSGYIPDPNTKVSLAETLEPLLGDSLEKGVKDYMRGILTTRQWIKQGKLKIGVHLDRVWYEFTHYIWDEREERLNRPKDKDDHLMECLHRLLMINPMYIPGSDEEFTALVQNNQLPIPTL